MIDFDWFTGIVGCIVFVALLLVAFVSGVSADSDIWKADCEKTGLHRSGDKVYDCKLRAA